MIDLPIPTEEDKKKYVDPASLPVPGTAPTGELMLPTPTEQQKATYVPTSALPVPPVSASSVDKEIEERSFFNRPIVKPEPIKDSEVAQIAAKHGVDPAELRSLAPYFGANFEGGTVGEATADALKGTASTLGQLALGIPQKLYKKTQSPEMERALDDLQNLAAGRESYAGLIGQTAAPAGVGSASASGLKALGAAAGLGAVAGAAGSTQGREVEGAAFGAGLGTALHGTATGLSKFLESRATPIEKSLAQKSGPDIEKGMQDVLESRAGSAKDIEAAVLGKGAEPTPEITETILKERVSPEMLEKLNNPQSEETMLLISRAEKELPQVVADQGEAAAVKQMMAQDVVDADRKDFVEFLTGKAPKTPEEAGAAMQAYAKAQGGDAALADQYKIWSEEKAARDYLADSSIRPGRENNFANKAINFVSDAQFVMRDIDNRTGVGVEPIHRDISRQLNRMSYPRQAFRNDLASIAKEARTAGVDDVVVGTDKIYKALDTGNFEGLSPAESRIAQRFHDYFSKGLDFVNGLVKEGKGDQDLTPLSIPRRANYVPYQMLAPRELETAIENRIGGIDLSEVTDKSRFAQLLKENPELSEAVEGLGRLDQAGPAVTGPQFLARVHDLFQTKEGRNALETQAKAALERTDLPLPEWMREKNLYKLADSWTSGTLRHLYLRKPVDQLASKMRLLRKAGADLEATYVQNLLSDLQGMRAGTAGAFYNSLGDRYSKAIDRLVGPKPGPLAQSAAGTLKAIPEILSDMNRQIYPNLLGLSAKAILMNSTQPLAKTLPEIGLTPYGSAALLRGGTFALANFRSILERTHSQGLAPAEFVGQFRRVLAEGIRRSSLYAVPNETLAKMGEVALHLYSRMDNLNRAIVVGTSDVIASDLARGSKAAQSALARFPQSVRRAVAGAGSEREVSDIIASHLNASTQYNYNRASLSEFGRTMGPFFSTFTKWPTATAGELMAEYREKGFTRGTIRNMEKYVAPLVLLAGADALLKYATRGDATGEFSDRQALLLGRGGLTESAPLGAAKSILEGKLFSPPALDLVLNGVLRPAAKGDISKLRKTLATGIQDFTPGSVYVRFLTQDLVTLITGRKPQGSDFIEKTQAGSRDLNLLGK